ncbi:MAG: sensor histidine kinase [Gemmatimonadales bacterium]
MSQLGMSRSDPRSTAALVAAASGASAAALGGSVIAGWLTVAVALIQVLPGFPPMQYNTALGFMICGAALLCAALDLRRPTAWLGILAGLIGSATLSQYLFRSELGIDQLLVETYLVTGVSNPGRMGPNSALVLTLIGAALLSLAWRPVHRHWHVCPALLGSVVIAVGTAALVGYAAGVPGAYRWSNFNPMAVHTAIGFTLLGGGIVGLAWNAAEPQSREAPTWIALVTATAVSTVTLCMWYALSAGSTPVLAPLVPGLAPRPTLPNLTLATGLLTAILLGWSVREGQISRRRARTLEATNRALHAEIQTRIQMEEAIQQLAAIVESSDDAILATTLDGRIMTWNPGAERLYGYTRAEAVGKHVSMLHGRRHNDAILFRRIGNGERVSRLETVNLTKDGRRIDVSLTVSPILDPSDRIVSASTIAHDITSLRLLDRMKDDFVGTVSHELRTPLTAIKGFIELVADGDAGPVTDTQREFLEIAARNSDKLGVLINDLIDMNLIESQRLEIRLEPLDLVSVLADVASTFRVMAQSKGLAFRQHVPPLPQVLGDSARLVQVFSNLVSNAIKYTPAGEVGIRAAASNGGVEVTVHDTGIGLSTEEHAQLFTRFFRGRNSVVTEAGGTGLGLVIAKTIVGRHNGKIDVESGPGEGSRFRVTLPAWVPGAAVPATPRPD